MTMNQNSAATCSDSTSEPLRLIIAGGRDYRITDFGYSQLERLRRESKIVEVVCGGATGADEVGRQWAIANQIPVKMFVADWETHGKSAGPLRNREMAEYGNALVLFPGGRGTESMYREAVANGLLIFDYRKSDSE